MVHFGQGCSPAHLDLDIVQCETRALGAAGTTHVSLIYLGHEDVLGMMIISAVDVDIIPNSQANGVKQQWLQVHEEAAFSIKY